MVPLTQRKPVLTPEQVERLPEFAALPSANQKDFVKLLAAGTDPMSAVGAVYNFQAKETARQFMYHMLRKPPMKAVLRELYGEDARTEFLRDVDRAKENPKLTVAQIMAVTLAGVCLGFAPSNFSFFASREAVLSKDDATGVSHLPDETRSEMEAVAEGDSYFAESNYRQANRRFQIAYLRRKIEEHRWNVSKTAAAIGLERASLTKKLKELGIQRSAVAEVKCPTT